MTDTTSLGAGALATSPATTDQGNGRAVTAPDTAAAAAVTRTVRLAARPPFSFSASLAFIRAFPAMTGQQGTAQDTLTLALRENGTTLGARVTAAPDEPAVDCVLTADAPFGDATAEAAADRLSFHLGLTDDLTDFYRLARLDRPFSRVVDRLHGYHQVKFPSPLELLCWAILCQRVPMPVARKMKQALVESVGNRITVDGETRWAFPDAEQLAALDEPALQHLIGNQRKAGYLSRATRQWLDLDEAFLRAGPYDEVRDQLLGLPGIGPWSATFLLIRGLGRTEHLTPDKEMTRAAERVYGRPLDDTAFAELTTRYGRHQGYWGHYLRVGG
ncbi:DNA-3-methyladenine glycosylase family protein [Streptomyces sp. NPDC059008]|uniref:DNA-3-methyladenine glycosylase family protein n=1 Tax=Streptomyces sp. NPDC059008 TaxID=3346693 RepID=UPI0036CDF432